METTIYNGIDRVYIGVYGLYNIGIARVTSGPPVHMLRALA